jgi:hypothetical protein
MDSVVRPRIIGIEDYAGVHNFDLDASASRIKKSAVYKDLSTIILTPAFGTMPTRCVAARENMFGPPNAKITKAWAVGMEVGEAFSMAISQILSHPELATWKYLLTLEHDNAPPPDGLVKLLARMEENPQFSAIGGLYWTKGLAGVPQIWGDPKASDLNFRPQPPVAGKLVECCGLGMGFTLFRLKMFKDKKLRKPWFKTTASRDEGTATQDLYFWTDARNHGYRCAVDCDVRVGHLDLEGKFGTADTMW